MRLYPKSAQGLSRLQRIRSSQFMPTTNLTTFIRIIGVHAPVKSRAMHAYVISHRSLFFSFLQLKPWLPVLRVRILY
ncbi:hypothetical protein ACQJBY_051267 [Aegilops geniculata]